MKETEKTASLLLSGASTYIINTIATLEQHIDILTKELQKTAKENSDLKKEIENLQVEVNKLTKSESNI